MKYCQNHARFPTTNKPRLLVLASVILICCVTFYHVDAAKVEPGKGVGVVISKSVILSNKLHYKDIVSIDNSNQYYSGKFIEKDGDLIRQSTPYQNSYGYYKFDSMFRVFVDPPQVIRNNIPMITIVSSLDEFHLQGQKKVSELRIDNETKPTESIRTYSKDRYVDETCTNAIITVKNWKTILPDTINYLRMKCAASATKLTTLASDIKPLTKQDISTSYKAKDQKWRDNIIKNCLKARNACKDLPQPTRGGL